MALYGVQFYLDCEELGLSCSQETFECRDDVLARKRFAYRVAKIRERAKKPDQAAIVGEIRLFRLNERDDQGTLLTAASAD